MPFKIFDYVNSSAENEIKIWMGSLQKIPLAKLNARIDWLALHGDGLFPDILTSTPVPGILKLRIRGGVQLRPMLCKGPLSINDEYTLLLGAKEVGGKLVPKNAPEIANTIKIEIIANPTERRVNHE